MHDIRCKQVCGENPNMLIPWYLLSSFAYYCDDNPILSDELYDELCKSLLDKYDSLVHTHKHLVDPTALEAGSAYHLSHDDYPGIVREASRRLQGDLVKPEIKKSKRKTKKVKTDEEPNGGFSASGTLF